MQIREADIEDIEILRELIHTSFAPVAKRFGLTMENCSRHPSFLSSDDIRNEIQNKGKHFLLLDSPNPCACVAYTKPNNENVVFLERLAVLPAYQGKGYGKTLVQEVCNLATLRKAKAVNIGIIHEDRHLAHWYSCQGFQLTETGSFPHLPFTVDLMTKKLI